jgi:hypothetical protein
MKYEDSTYVIFFILLLPQSSVPIVPSALCFRIHSVYVLLLE